MKSLGEKLNYLHFECGWGGSQWGLSLPSEDMFGVLGIEFGVVSFLQKDGLRHGLQ